MPGVNSFYYINSPWGDGRNFCCFICVNYRPCTLL